MNKTWEDVYLQSIPIVLAYNKVNHYTATKLISQQEFQSWKIQQCCMLGQNFIKLASFVNKQFVSEEVGCQGKMGEREGWMGLGKGEVFEKSL